MNIIETGTDPNRSQEFHERKCREEAAKMRNRWGDIYPSDRFTIKEIYQ